MTVKPKKEIKKWAETTTMHGITNILDSENWLKRLIYVSLILGAFGMVGYYVHARLVDFMAFDVVTSYRKVAYVNNSVQFPNIAICNRNRFFLYDFAAKNKFQAAKTGLINLLGVQPKNKHEQGRVAVFCEAISSSRPQGSHFCRSFLRYPTIPSSLLFCYLR